MEAIKRGSAALIKEDRHHIYKRLMLMKLDEVIRIPYSDVPPGMLPGFFKLQQWITRTGNNRKRVFETAVDQNYLRVYRKN